MTVAYRFKGKTVNGRPQEFHAELPARSIHEDELVHLNKDQIALLKASPLYDKVEKDAPTKAATTRTATKRTAKRATTASETHADASDGIETTDSTIDDDAAPTEPAATDKE